jgi:biopolymer transport protein ExbD
MLDESHNTMLGAEEEPHISLPRKRHALEGDLDITPMIDITFLLLIFFIVAARVQQSGTATLPTARFGEGVSMKTAAILTVIAGPGENAEVFMGDTVDGEAQVKASNLVDQEREIADYIEQQFAGDPPEVTAKEHVLIKAARDVRSREVSRVARAAAKANTSKTIKMHFAVREEEQ